MAVWMKQDQFLQSVLFAINPTLDMVGMPTCLFRDGLLADQALSILRKP